LLVGRAHGGLDAAVGEEAAEHDGLDLAAAEDEVEVGGRERVEAALALDDDVRLRRLHLVADLRAPGAFDESGRVDHALQDPVDLVLVAELAVAGREGDRRVDDGRAGLARLVGHATRVGEHAGVVHDALDGVMQGAPIAREVVLVLDQDDGGLSGVDIHGGLPWVGWEVKSSADGARDTRRRAGGSSVPLPPGRTPSTWPERTGSARPAGSSGPGRSSPSISRL